MNMADASATYHGPVKDLLHAAMTDVYGHLDLRASRGFFATGPGRLDFRSGVETAFSAMMGLGKKVDLHGGLGAMGNAAGFSPEVMLCQAEIISTIKWLERGIDTAADKLAVDLIDCVGPKGHFLETDQTLELARSDEHYQGAVLDTYALGPEGDWIEHAAAKVEQIVGEHRPAVPEHRLELLQRYVHDHAAATV